ncbi:methyl-accepting chemotaxis protein [Paenibacillus ginsengarvi]|uniref:Methyl-accepting chemotaxis protein n=1 Tax=Paenibacillus ginsengarvi TaxID=400777 RepID=A0A3B0CL49_9BACL|nr:methyl-accepting chemotaxis protein [Paenibacillus ginsengarvi]RKN85468.1 methyl-accepting chemotaxis protein [Paenibacillus ginsengarvi]
MAGKLTFMWKTKLMVGFAVVAALFAAAALFNLQQAQGIKEQLHRQNAKVSLQLEALELKVLVQEMKDISSGLMISRDEAYVAKFIEKRQTFQDMIRAIGETASTDDQRQWRSQMIMAETEFLDLFDRAVNIIRNNSLTERDIQKNTESLYKETQVQRDVIFDLVGRFYLDYSTDADAAVAATNEKMNGSVTVLLIAAGLVLLLTVFVSLTLVRSFMKPIRRMRHTMSRIGDGDLRHRVDSVSSDEFGQLGRSFDAMIGSVAGMLARLRDIGESLNERSASFKTFAGTTAAANAEVMKAFNEIASGSNEQAAYTESSAGLVGELGQEVREIARSADEMKRLGEQADAQAKTGAEAVAELEGAAVQAEAMLHQAEQAFEAFTLGAEQIGKIVHTITAIAQQTNVLSLNASIEAARAGAYGKGFLVIADEVRSLSEQSKASAQSITGLVAALQAHMTKVTEAMTVAGDASRVQGAKVQHTLEAFCSIKLSIEALYDRADEIHAKVKKAEENGAVLTDALQHMAAIAEQSAAGAQEVNVASAEQNESVRLIALQADAMHELAENLFAEIGKFRIGEQAAPELAALSEPEGGEEIPGGSRAEPGRP